MLQAVLRQEQMHCAAAASGDVLFPALMSQHIYCCVVLRTPGACLLYCWWVEQGWGLCGFSSTREAVLCSTAPSVDE